jgi:histidinol-phosphatase (PHP family)
MGGTVLTVGSDAHRPQDVGADVPAALHMARVAGFTHVAVYERRMPVLVELADCAVFTPSLA